MSLRPQWLGRVPYREAWRHQRARRAGILAGYAPEAFWLLEHPSVVTTGLRQVPDLPSAAWLRSRGADLVRIDRGGLATWHGPGQLVGYPILDLRSRRLRIRDLIGGIEDGVIAWLVGVGLSAGRREGYPGVWVGRDKVCAVGVHVEHGVSNHGFALNLTTDLVGFSLITPCGITDGGVTSVRRLRGDSPAPVQAAEAVGWEILRAFEYRAG